MSNSDKEKVLDFIRSQKLAVVSTAGNNKPESALIAHVEDDHLCIYFQTGQYTRKATNLQSNPHISFVFGLSLDAMKTVQYDGEAEQLIDPEDIALCKQRFIVKDSPTTPEYFNRPGAIFFKATPTWIGCSDDSGDKPVVFEIKEFD